MIYRVLPFALCTFTKILYRMKRYFSEKNALTVFTSAFCMIMTIVSALNHMVWQAVAFALAFSFSVELICHRAKEKS